MTRGPLQTPSLRRRASAKAELETRLLEPQGLNRRSSRFGHSRAYFVADREIAHFQGDGRMDVRLTRERIRELKAQGRLEARIRTRGPSADRLTVRVAQEEDLPLALHLAEEAIRTNS